MREMRCVIKEGGLGSLYSEMDGQDHSKMIVSNVQDEDRVDLVLKIKSQVIL
jgi:hypothetical protein